MDYKRIIATALFETLAAQPFEFTTSVETALATFEIPPRAEMGDLAFPCFWLAKALRKSPAVIAKDLREPVSRLLPPEQFAAVQANGPYLNFSISTPHLAKNLVLGVLGGKFLAARESTQIRMMIEYSQPNTHKGFHVGHTRNVALGDSLIRICEWSGHEVIAANYIGDEGAHIAKCLWYYREHFQGDVPPDGRGEFLGELYANATKMLDFTTLAQAPIPDVITARVQSMSPFAKSGRNVRVSIAVDSSETAAEVVCGGSGFKVGDVVAYAKPGARINGRLVEAVTKHGVVSQGMICSESEIGLGPDNDAIHVFPSDTPIGVEIAELTRLPGTLPDAVSVVSEVRARQQGVSNIMMGLEEGEPSITELWRETRQWSLDEFDEIYDWLQVRFDHVFFESEVNESGKQIVREYQDQGVLVESEGTIGADLSEVKLPFFILLRSDGTGLYSTKDIGLAHAKFKDFGINRSVYVVDASQTLHFQQVFKTLEMMGFEQARECFHLAYGMVVLPDGKMSSRKGNVILFSDLRERLSQKIREEYLERYVGEWSDEEIAQATKRIAIATIKYGMLNQDNSKNIVFDLEQWASRSGNTGPYLLYAYARIVSILGELGIVDPEGVNWKSLTHEAEANLLRHVTRFPEVIVDASDACHPQLVCIYLYDLAKLLNRFYENCHILKAESEDLKNARGALVKCVGLVLQKGLELLGIATVDRM